MTTGDIYLTCWNAISLS